MDKEKLLRAFCYVICFVLVLAVCWYLLREPAVHDQRDAARDVEQSLERAGAEQQRAVESAERIQSGLERSVVVIERIEERTGNAESAVGRAASGNEAARRVVEDSQRRKYNQIAELELNAWDEAAGWFYWNYQLLRDREAPTDESWKESWDLNRCLRNGWLTKEMIGR